MAFIFKKKKTPKIIADSLVEAIRGVSVILTKPLEPGAMPPLSSSASNNLSAEDQAGLEMVGKRLAEARLMMCGDSDNQPKKEDSVGIAQNLREQGVPLTLIQNLGVLPFEARNDAVFILSYMIQTDLAQFATKFLRAKKKQVTALLVNLFADAGIALHCGSLMRDCLRYEFFAEEFLENSCWVYDKFFDEYLVCESFDICSDAFATFRMSLTKHMSLVPPFLVENYDKFFPKYNKLLVSNQYVTQRQSLKLLGELLLDRQNYNVMMTYIGDKDNLKIIMNLMREKSTAIQAEAFHVFKVFVANPKKTEPVAQILARNRDKIIAYLQTLNIDKEDDQFIEERNLLIATLGKMKLPSKEAKEPATPGSPVAASAETGEAPVSAQVPPSASPTESANVAPTSQPADVPSDSANVAPTSQPADVPTESANVAPTSQPADVPSESANAAPTSQPVDAPSESANAAPTSQPVDAPSEPTSQA